MENLEFWKIFFATKILKYPHGCGEKDHDRISTCCLSYLHGFVSLYSSNEVKWDAFPIGSAENGVENGAFSIGLGGSSRIFVIFTPILWEMIWFDEHIFRMGGLTFGSPCLAAPRNWSFSDWKFAHRRTGTTGEALGSCIASIIRRITLEVRGISLSDPRTLMYLHMRAFQAGVKDSLMRWCQAEPRHQHCAISMTGGNLDSPVPKDCWSCEDLIHVAHQYCSCASACSGRNVSSWSPASSYGLGVYRGSRCCNFFPTHHVQQWALRQC